MTDGARALTATDRLRPWTESLRLIGVAPASATKRHRRLLGALEAAFPVTFRAVETSETCRLDGLDGLLVLGDGDGALDLTRLPPSCALLIAGGHNGERVASEALVEFTGGPPVAYPLRERKLREQSAPTIRALGSVPPDTVLALADGKPVWWCGGGGAWRHQSAYTPHELGDRETLRERFQPGRFMGLVALLHLLWRVCGDLQPGPRRLRGSFVIDDPNLHWPSYGHLRYRELARHAAEHGYHVGLAMVPLDGWLTSSRAASLLRRNGAFLSLLVHGNTHTSRELGALASDHQAVRAVGQALRRIARFEERSGVPVARVMAPPHGACSEASARAMFRLGFEAVCVSRAYPWRDELPPLSGADGWLPAEMAAGGLPVLPRYPIGGPREDLIFRALLGQPLILYGHHRDFAGGLDALAQAASDVNRLGEVSWGSVEDIARRNYLASTDGERMVIRLHSRRAAVQLPEGVSSVLVNVPVTHGYQLWDGVSCDSRAVPMRRAGAGWASQAIPVTGGSTLHVRLDAREPLDPAALASPRSGAWPILRRLLVESRDRADPLVKRLRGGG